MKDSAKKKKKTNLLGLIKVLTVCLKMTHHSLLAPRRDFRDSLPEDLRYEEAGGE